MSVSYTNSDAVEHSLYAGCVAAGSACL